MKTGAALIKFLLVVLLAACGTGVFAQTYPITNINISLPAAPDPNTGNWGGGNSQLRISATSVDLTRPGQGNGPGIQDKLLLYVKKDGAIACGAYTNSSAPKVSFDRLIMVWSGKDAVAFLGGDCVLPPGEYELSVQFFGYANGVTFAISKEIKKKFTIRGNQPPNDQKPGAFNTAISVETRPTDTKRQPGNQPGVVSPGVETDAKVADAKVPGNQQLTAVSQAVETEPKPSKPKKPGLLDRLGKIAISTTGVNGSVTIDLSPPAVCDCGNWSPITINRTMKFECGEKRAIPWKCGEPLEFLSTYNCTSKDKSCQAVTAWEIKKDGASIKTGNSTVDATDAFTPAANGNYTITLNADCNGVKCPPAVYNIVVKDCKTCDCGNWVNPVVMIKAAARTVSGLKCSESASLPKGHYSITIPDFVCSSNGESCAVSYSWSVRGGRETVNGTGQTFNYDFSSAGVYTVEMTPNCGGKNCRPCSITINIEDNTPITIVPDPGTYTPGNPVSKNQVNNRRSNDTTSASDGKYYYDINETTDYQYTEIFDHTLSVQFTNNYASVENIKLNIYDVASHTMFNPKGAKEVKLVSVTGVNRLSVDLNTYKLEPGRLYLFTVSVFSSNYHLNFKVISDHEK